MQNKHRIGIIGAMEMETAGLAAVMENARAETVSGIGFTTGLLEGMPAVVATCGVGKVAAALCAEAMILRYGVTALLNTGVAGGLAPRLAVGDVVIADKVVQHDMDTSAIGDPVGLISGLNLVYIQTDKTLCNILTAASEAAGLHTVTGTVASGDLFVAKAADKARIAAQFGAAACEMEGAAIGQVACTNGVPFAVIRAISDGGDGMEFSEFAPLAATRSIAVTRDFARRLAKI